MNRQDEDLHIINNKCTKLCLQTVGYYDFIMRALSAFKKSH